MWNCRDDSRLCENRVKLLIEYLTALKFVVTSYLMDTARYIYAVILSIVNVSFYVLINNIENSLRRISKNKYYTKKTQLHYKENTLWITKLYGSNISSPIRVVCHEQRFMMSYICFCTLVWKRQDSNLYSTYCRYNKTRVSFKETGLLHRANVK